MDAMNAALCGQCDGKVEWAGRLTDMPRCSQCGHVEDVAFLIALEDGHCGAIEEKARAAETLCAAIDRVQHGGTTNGTAPAPRRDAVHRTAQHREQHANT